MDGLLRARALLKPAAAAKRRVVWVIAPVVLAALAAQLVLFASFAWVGLGAFALCLFWVLAYSLPFLVLARRSDDPSVGRVAHVAWIGSDGVQLEGVGFVPFRDIVDARVEERRLVLDRGEAESDIVLEVPPDVLDDVRARVLACAAERAPVSDDAEALSLARVRVAVDEGAYRGGAIDRERAWTVVEDVAAPPDARIAASEVLRVHLSPDERAELARVRSQTAHPRVRLALAEAAEAPAVAARAARS